MAVPSTGGVRPYSQAWGHTRHTGTRGQAHLLGTHILYTIYHIYCILYHGTASIETTLVLNRVYVVIVAPLCILAQGGTALPCAWHSVQEGWGLGTGGHRARAGTMCISIYTPGILYCTWHVGTVLLSGVITALLGTLVLNLTPHFKYSPQAGISRQVLQLKWVQTTENISKVKNFTWICIIAKQFNLKVHHPTNYLYTKLFNKDIINDI